MSGSHCAQDDVQPWKAYEESSLNSEQVKEASPPPNHVVQREPESKEPTHVEERHKHVVERDHDEAQKSCAGPVPRKKQRKGEVRMQQTTTTKMNSDQGMDSSSTEKDTTMTQKLNYNGQ